jgi:hypothetical protein
VVEEDEDEGQEEQAHWVEASHVGPRYDCTTLELHGLEPLCLVGRLKLRFSSSFEAWPLLKMAEAFAVAFAVSWAASGVAVVMTDTVLIARNFTSSWATGPQPHLPLRLASLLFLAVVAATDPGVSSGPLHVRVNAETLGLTVTFAEHGTAVAFGPEVHLDGALHAYSAGGSSGVAPPGMQCRLSPGGVEHGSDSFGKYTSLSINCTAGTSNTPVDYAIKAYEASRPGSLPRGDGLVIFDVAMPRGGTGLRMRDFVAGSSDRSPPQFAPFPAFDLDASPALRSSVALCHGSERPHMLASEGVAEMSSQCTTLSGGMTTLGWTSEHSATSIAGAVVTAANEFHLSLNRLIAARPRGTGGSHSESDDAGSAAGEGGGKVWSHGLSGEIDEVPAGFAGRTMLYYSGDGLNAAVDGWGTTLRQAYATEKQDNEDLFLQTVTLWTDNGAALNGERWRTNATRPVAAHGQYQQLNFSAVDQASIGAVGDSIASTGVSARGAQIDCWW